MALCAPPVDALAAGAVAALKVTTLRHEPGDDSVELDARKVQREIHFLVPNPRGSRTVCS